MAELYETERQKERLIVFAVQTNQNDDTSQSLDELEELIDTAGAVTVGRMIQNLDHPNGGLYLGTGKAEELKWMVFEQQADGVVCDDELSPAQIRNLSEYLSCRVLDRTLVILDIFAKHATSYEGKLQVELAEQQYRLTRLAGLGTSLSRTGGGIGTRGPGEKKLETDRRVIRDRISALRAELKEVDRHREVTKSKRKKNGLFSAALVGYTNSGKSTLMNALTDSNLYTKDQLFATLDPAVRRLTLPECGEILLTDTVGFIRKLPHGLIDAFRSTLEEAKDADLLIHVVDASDPDRDMQMHVVYETLEELSITGKPVITLFNKQDKVRELLSDPDISGKEKENLSEKCRDVRADETLEISARTGEGLSELKEMLVRILTDQRVCIEKTFPYAEAGEVSRIRKEGQILEETYTEDGIFIRALVKRESAG